MRNFQLSSAAGFLAGSLMLSGCSDHSEKKSETEIRKEEGMAITVKSGAFVEGGRIPRIYTGEGKDISPPLGWSGVPEKTREIALICDDPDAPTPKPWVHWVAYKIPAASPGLKEGSAGGALEGRNDFGKNAYGGPMPPPGHGTHHYHFKIYALDAELNLKAGATKEQLLKAMEGHILGEGRLVGTYERK